MDSALTRNTTLLGAGGLGPLADAQNLHRHVSEVEGLSEGKPDTTKGINREFSCLTALKSMKQANPPPMIDIMRTRRRLNCSRTVIASNETKMSDGELERALLGAEVWKSS